MDIYNSICKRYREAPEYYNDEISLNSHTTNVQIVAQLTAFDIRFSKL